MMTGGVAKNIGLVRTLEKLLDTPIEVSAYAQENGAIGAALLAQRIKVT
jgi:activator of 2-hydroxyglutaryl-CoA dehydratase